MISQELMDAIESARTCEQSPGALIHRAVAQRHLSFEKVRAIVHDVVRELPDGMTAAEIRDELEISNNQLTRRGEK